MIISFLDITIENERGKIKMGGGNGYAWRIQKIDGLGMPKKAFNTSKYAGENGQHTNSVVRNSRTITISGDIKNNGNLQHEITRATRICDMDNATVKIRFNNKQRKSTCHISAFALDDRSAIYQKFAMQIICDDPYFSDFENNNIAIFKRTSNLKTTFTLPCVFSARTSKSDVFVSGDIKTEPIITLHCTKVSSDASATSGLVLKNKLPDGTEQAIELSTTTMIASEIITIDFFDRKVTSSENGNIISELSLTSYLSNFWLDTGVNHITVVNRNTNSEIVAYCSYTNKYCEAVY